MRRYYRLIILFTLCLVGFFGCGKPLEEDPTKPASLELLKKLVTADPKGGEVVVGFVLSNPDGSQLEGRCADSWCHDFKFPEDGMMTFTVDANTEASSRITNVYISYGEIEVKFTLSQAGGGEDLEAISKMKFDISYVINGPEVKMTVDPEFDNVRYYFAYSTKEEIDNIGADRVQAIIKANVQQFLQGEVNALVNYSGYTVTQALDEYTGYGVRSASMTINARTEYVGWACAISNEVNVISDVVMSAFKTGDVPPSDNRISVKIDNINCDRVSFSVDTSNEDQYAVYILPAEQVEGKTDEQIVEAFNTSDDVTVYLQFGDYSATQVNLENNKDYYVLAYGYKWGMATTSIVREKFKTIAYEGGTPSFTFNMEKVNNFRLSGNVECSASTFLYYTDYCDADTKAEDIISELNETIDWFVNKAGYYPNKISLMRVIGTRGTTDFDYKDGYIVPEGNYKLYAIAIDETTGEFCTEVIFSETITTPKVSEIKVRAYYNHYFDAIAIAEKYPQTGYVPAYVNGYAVVPLIVETNENVADYYVDIFTDDLSDTSDPTDHQLFMSLYERGQHNRTPVFVLCDFYNTTKLPLTISSVAIDKDGNRGPVQRTVIQLPFSGCADPSEFAPYLQSDASMTSKAAEANVAKKRTTRLETLIKKDRNE